MILLPAWQRSCRHWCSHRNLLKQHWQRTDLSLAAVQAAGDVAGSACQGACPAVAVAGSKGVGKSTVARLLVNHLLEVCPAVAFLDCDCGQAELTVPGEPADGHTLCCHGQSAAV